MTERLPRLLLPLLCALALLRPSGAQVDVPFHTIAVLPAVNQSENKRLGFWGLGLQYLVQERIRELNGLAVARLAEAPDLLDAYLAGKLDVSSIAARTQIAEALEADILIAPVILKGPDGAGQDLWELRADVLQPATGPRPIGEVALASGSVLTAVQDQLAEGALKVILKLADVPLPAYPATPVISSSELQTLGYSIYLWPYSGVDAAAKGKLDQAVDLLGKAAARPGAFWLTYARYLEVCQAAKKPAEADGVIRRWAGTLWQRDARVALVFGQCLLATGKDTDAKDKLIAAAKLSKGAIPAVDALVHFYRRAGQPENALAQYQSAAGLCPNVRPFRLKLGQTALELHQPEVAVTAFRAAVNLAPKKIDGHRGLVAASLDAKRPGEAWTAAQALLPLATEVGDKLLVVRAGVAAQQAAAVRELAAEVAKAAPQDPLAQGLLGQVAVACEDWPTAQTACTAAIKLNPKELQNYRNLATAQLYAAKPDYAAIVATYQAAIKAAPDVERPSLLLEMAAAQLYGQQYEAGVKTAREAAALLPMDPAPLYLEARLQLYKGDPKATVEALMKAFELDPKAAGAGPPELAYYEGEDAAGRGFDNLKLVLAYFYQVAGRNRDARRQYTDYLKAPNAALAEWAKEQLAQLAAD
ncbi:MAG: hypothetical protein IT204_03885 [Fimbriimonadaceae bacterium]|nr:hypothetical protein [Fimbriimonadaceae bacterium]